MMFFNDAKPEKCGGFLRREDGSVAIETVILLPMLFWAYLSMFSIFDAYRQYSINQKAAYTIGDMISRETAPIGDSYLDGAQDLFDYMTRSDDRATLRVTSVQYNAKKDEYTAVWSKVRGTATPLGPKDVGGWHHRLPVLPDNDHILVVETWLNYDPPFNTGLEDRQIINFVFTRPRYVPCIIWNNGTNTNSGTCGPVANGGGGAGGGGAGG